MWKSAIYFVWVIFPILGWAESSETPWVFPEAPNAHSHLAPYYKGFYLERRKDVSRESSIMLIWVDQEGKQRNIELKKLDPISSTIIDMGSPNYSSSAKLDPETDRSYFGFSIRIFWALRNF